MLRIGTQLTEEWFELRKNKIGSSDAAAICGVNPWRSKFAVYLEKTLQEPDVEKSPEVEERLEWGHRLQPLIANAFAEKSRLDIALADGCYQHPRFDCMIASPDAFVWENGKQGLLEIKNTSEWSKGDWENSGIPDSAHVQILHQMAVTGLEFGYIAALVGGNRLEYRRVQMDRGLIERIEDLCVDFWRLVRDKTPPPLAANDSEVLGYLFPHSTKTDLLSLGRHAEHLAREYLLAKEQAKHFDEIAEEASNNLKLLLADSEQAEAGMFRIRWKDISSERLDTKALKSEHPEIAKKFTKSSSYRRFDVKELAIKD